MKLLVTGGAGYIGSHTAHQLVEAGHEVVVLDNFYSGHRWSIPAKAHLVEGSVGDRGLLEAVFQQHRFDGVLHFAAHIEVGESVTSPSKYYRNNTLSSFELFDACVKAQIPNLIFSSTAAVYGEPTQEGAIHEGFPLQPMNPYGASKLMSERMLQDLAAASGGAFKFAILRYFNACGARPDLTIGQATPRATHLIKIASEAALGVRSSMSIYGADYPTKDGTCLRDYIHIEDLASAHLKALAYLAAGGNSDIFNVGVGGAYSVREVIDTMKKVTGRDFKVTESPRRAGDPSALTADSTKIRKVLGWNPQYNDLSFMCKTAYEWEKAARERGLIKS